MSFQQGKKNPGAGSYPKQQYHPPPPQPHGGAPYPTASHQTYNPIGFNCPTEMPQPLNIPVYPPMHSTSIRGGTYPPSAPSTYPTSSSSHGVYPPPQSTYPSENLFRPTQMPPSFNIPTYQPSAPPCTEGYSSLNKLNTGGYPPNSSYTSPPTSGYPSSHPLSHNPPSYDGFSNSIPFRPAPGVPLGGHGSQQRSPVYQPPQKTPTVRPAQPFNPKQDAEILRAAMKGFGCDDKALINILAFRTNAQRQQIAKEYKVLFGRDLIENLKSETKGNLETLLVSMMTPLPQYYAKELHHAMAGLGTDESVLIEIMCTKSNAEIMTIRSAYHALYKTSLEEDLKDDTGGHFKRLMVSLCNANRDESMRTNYEAARQDAESLKKAGVDCWGTDESIFNMVLCQRNWAQLQLVFQEYQKVAGNDIEEAIKNEFSGDIERGLLAVIRSIKNQAGFFAKCLNESMKGLGTRDRSLIRLVVTRSEIDMVEIKKEYMARYRETLAEAIKGDTSGNYKKCLLALIGEGPAS